MFRRFCVCAAVVLVLLSVVVPPAFASLPVESAPPSMEGESSQEPAVGADDGFMSYDAFMDAYGADADFSVMAVQSAANTPVTANDASGLKRIMLQLLGDYMPAVTQLRYQANTTQNYTYVNDIQPDYPWLVSAGIFAICLYCVFRLGGALLCRT